MNAMEEINDIFYANQQWKKIRDYVVTSECVSRGDIIAYFKSVEELNRTKNKLKRGIKNGR